MTEQLFDVTEVVDGRTYVLEVPHRLSRDQAAQISAVWKAQAPKAKLLILDGGMRISEMPTKDVKEFFRSWLRQLDEEDVELLRRVLGLP